MPIVLQGMLRMEVISSRQPTAERMSTLNQKPITFAVAILRLQVSTLNISAPNEGKYRAEFDSSSCLNCYRFTIGQIF